ncbi:MAG: hypothetical protein HKN79_08535 [Flavobacteriales bacterium]|nr:hypothetical protein [Flavobacteriales bacterium]
MTLGRILLSLIVLCSFLTSDAQAPETSGPSSNGIITEVSYVPSIAQQLKDGTFIPAEERTGDQEMNPKRRDGNRVVPGKGTPLGDDPLYELQKNSYTFKSNPPLLVFDADPSNGSTPSDPTGAVGPNHYLGAWNTAFRIFDKDGVPLTPEASLSSVLTGNNLGDPIIMYDKWADRFIITEFDSSPNGFEMAVCAGPDPVNDGWYLYQAQFTTGSFPDYTKFSIWSDGYYVTANVNNGANGDRIWVVERDQMLNGLPAQYVGFPLPGIATFGFYSPQVLNVTGGEMPEPGNATVVYMQDNAWFGVSTDHLKLWNVNVDWNNINNSEISGATQINTETFTGVFDGGSFSNLQQPSGPDIDCLQATIMNQAQFRKFPTHNSAVFNFVVDALGAGELAAVRWYELRQDADGEPWEIYQEGTYTSPAGGKHAFAASMAMDANGNIGMAYSTVSSSENIAIQYTGRLANDPLNTMTVEETLIAQGSGNDPSFRYADYTHCTVDPVDEKKFWHIAEYFDPIRKDVVGVFKIAPDLNTDVGVVDILSPTTSTMGTDESVTVLVRNFGIDPISNVPVEFTLDGGAPLAGIITEEIAPGAMIEYTLTGTVDLSVTDQEYELFATTLLGTDQDATNDAYSTSATNLMPNDLGVVYISEPIVGDEQPDDEDVTVTIHNYGGTTHSDFLVGFSVNGGTPVIETVAGPLGPGEYMQYEFDAEADMNGIGDFELNVFTSLTDDTQPDNDSYIITVPKNVCQPVSNCAQGDGIRHLVLENIDNISDCGTNGYSAFLDQVAALNQGNIYDMSITTEHGSQFVRAWVDFNDSFTFTGLETVLSSTEIAEGEGPGLYTDILPVEIESDDDLGEHLLRVKTNRDGTVPGNACNGTTFGETEDYKVIIGSVDLLESILGPNDIEIRTLGDDRFQIYFDSEVSHDPLTFQVMDTQGRMVVFNWIYPSNGVYTYDLDMSYAASGAYLIRIGDDRAGKIERIIVQ